MTLSSRLAAGAVAASMALSAVPASALSIDLYGDAYGSAGRSHIDVEADASMKTKRNRVDVNADASTQAKVAFMNWNNNGRHLGWFKNWKNGSGGTVHGSGTVVGSGRLVAGYEKSIDASLKASATLSAKISKRICTLLGEEGDSMTQCMNDRKAKIKAAFNAMIDAAFTASVSTDNN